MRVGRGVLVAGLLLGHGCQSDDEFQCQTHEQCVSNGVTGMCQPSGYCSFEDAACPSGFRYGDSAAPGLAGQCVEPDAETTGGTQTGPVTTGVSAASISATGVSTSTSSGEPDGSSESSSGTSTDATSSTSSTGSSSEGTSTDATSSSTDASSTGGGMCPALVEEFDNGVLDEDPWTLAQSVPPIAFEAGETLRFSISPGLNTFASVSLDGVDIASGHALAHLVALPQDPNAEFILQVSEAGAMAPLVEILVTGPTQVSARSSGAVLDDAALIEEPDDLWLELYFSDGVATFAYSVDGEVFETMASAAVAADLSSVDIGLLGGAAAVTTEPLHIIEVDDFEYCPDPFPMPG